VLERPPHAITKNRVKAFRSLTKRRSSRMFCSQPRDMLRPVP
jgi:hypothetical protein